MFPLFPPYKPVPSLPEITFGKSSTPHHVYTMPGSQRSPLRQEQGIRFQNEDGLGSGIEMVSGYIAEETKCEYPFGSLSSSPHTQTRVRLLPHSNVARKAAGFKNTSEKGHDTSTLDSAVILWLAPENCNRKTAGTDDGLFLDSEPTISNISSTLESGDISLTHEGKCNSLQYGASANLTNFPRSANPRASPMTGTILSCPQNRFSYSTQGNANMHEVAVSDRQLQTSAPDISPEKVTNSPFLQMTGVGPTDVLAPPLTTTSPKGLCCGEFFYTRAQYTIHRNAQNRKTLEQFCCLICPACCHPFKNFLTAMRHFDVVHCLGTVVRVCDSCGSTPFTSKRAYENHMGLMHRSSGAMGGAASSSKTRSRALPLDGKEPIKQIFVCYHCEPKRQRKYSLYSSLRRHISQKHSTLQGKYSCGFGSCPYMTNNRMNLKTHQTVHMEKKVGTVHPEFTQ